MKRLLDLCWTFCWISAVTLGGGLAMLPVMEREFVEKRGWLSEDEMVDIIAVVQSMPGIIAVNMAVMIGHRVAGAAGAAAAAFGSAAAPFAVIAGVSAGLAALPRSPAVDRVFLGVRAGTAALILLSAVNLAKKTLDGPLAWTLGAAVFAAVALLRVEATFAVIIGLAAGAAVVAAGARRKGGG